MAWQIEIDGRVYTELDLSLDDCEWVCDRVGSSSWLAVDPVRGPKNLKAIAAAFIRQGTDLTYDQALEQVGPKGMGIIASYTKAEEDDRPTQHQAGVPLDPPKADPATS
jgi:hypothetical protein